MESGRPNIDALNLENVGVQIENGHIVTDKHKQYQYPKYLCWRCVKYA